MPIPEPLMDIGLLALADVLSITLVFLIIKKLAFAAYAQLTFLLLGAAPGVIDFLPRLSTVILASIPVAASYALHEAPSVLWLRTGVSIAFLLLDIGAAKFELRENGVFSNGRYLSWNEIRRFSWAPARFTSAEILKLNPDWRPSMTLRVQAKQQPVVARIVASARRFEGRSFGHVAYFYCMNLSIAAVVFAAVGLVWLLLTHGVATVLQWAHLLGIFSDV